jgi:hypothetical protein
MEGRTSCRTHRKMHLRRAPVVSHAWITGQRRRKAMTEDREYWEHHFKELEENVDRGYKWFFGVTAVIVGFCFWLLFCSGWAH